MVADKVLSDLQDVYAAFAGTVFGIRTVDFKSLHFEGEK